MKTYVRKIFWIPVKPTAIVTLCVLCFHALIGVLAGPASIGFLLCLGPSIICLFGLCAELLILCSCYRCTTTGIELTFLRVKYWKIKYKDFKGALISNAAYYTDGYGNSTIPMQYKCKGTNGTLKVTYPYLTLLYPGFILKDTAAGQSSREVYFLGHVYSIGICWFDALRDFLEYNELPVYVLEDVYLRFFGMFDHLFETHQATPNRFFIIDGTGVRIPHDQYRKEKKK